MIENKRIIDISNVKLIQEVNNKNHIKIIEAIHIRKNKQKNLMNTVYGKYSVIFNQHFLKKLVIFYFYFIFYIVLYFLIWF